eukprot:6008859-Amphidinium_carterae.1
MHVGGDCLNTCQERAMYSATRTATMATTTATTSTTSTTTTATTAAAAAAAAHKRFTAAQIESNNRQT